MFVETRFLFKKSKIAENGKTTDLSNIGIRYSDLYENPIARRALTDHFQPRTAWEDWVFLTRKCNLACSYCFEHQKDDKRAWSVDELINFLRWQTQERDRKYYQENSKLVFYGGEPLLEQELIAEIMKKAADLPFDFGLQTNGTLLDHVTDFDLNRLKLISVSVDGTKEQHDENRRFKDGRGSYDLVITNLRKVKERYNGRILARMTVPIMPRYDFFAEMKSVIDTGLFTDYHWQLETPICRELSERDLSLFLDSYVSGVEKLVAFWVKEMMNGRMINIIPFETVVKQIILDELVVDLRAGDSAVMKKEAKGLCGCGDKLVTVDLDGRCYPCDTLVGTENSEIGDIWKGADPRRFIENNNFFVYGKFKGCPRRTVKGVHQIAYTKETEGCPIVSQTEPDFYCRAAGGFINKIREHMKEILRTDIINFFSPVAEYTEQVP